MDKFKLSDNFVKKYQRKKPPFGFNGLGELVYMRTYSRIKEDGKMRDGGKLSDVWLKEPTICKKKGLMHMS